MKIFPPLEMFDQNLVAKVTYSKITPIIWVNRFSSPPSGIGKGQFYDVDSPRPGLKM